MEKTNFGTDENGSQSFLQQWGLFVFFAVVVACAGIGVRVWLDQKYEAPVIKEYADFLAYMATNSPQAGTYLKTYFAHHRRDTVASQHYEHVCGVMYALSVSDGVAPKKYSEAMASGCESFSRYYDANSIP